MYKLNINNAEYYSPVDKSLLDFLRYDACLTSVKDGCGEGACGACMVIIDGKATVACVQKLSKLQDKKIITCEGLSEREKEVYVYAFGFCGAVQCGFCIPGMVISAKALLGVTPDPTEIEVRKAIRRNICRCTGYVKIVEAIMLAAKMLRENTPVPTLEPDGKLVDMIRLDAEEKTLGTGIYSDDMSLPGMLFASAVRTKFPRARFISIDTTAAKAHPNCVAILTAADVAGSIKMGHLKKDWDAFIAVGDTTRYIGDALCLVVCDKREVLNEVKNLVTFELEELTPVKNPAEALADGAPEIHEGGNVLTNVALKRGDAKSAIENSKFKVTEHYSVPFTDHAFLEPECALAAPEGDGVVVYTGSQSIYDEQREISAMLGLEKEQVRCRANLVGGGFGGKEDMSVQHHAALAAFLLKKPVKVKFSRAESIFVHTKRHAMEIDMTTACDENGKITAMRATIISDTGAYASLGGPVLQRACTHAAGPYNFQNLEIDGKAVYTNNPPAGAFRGFGVPQTCFAMESNIDLLADMVGISPWEMRYANAVRPGDTLPNGQIAGANTAMAQCLEAVRKVCETEKYAGIAIGMKNSGLGVGIPDYGRAILSVEDGKIHIRASAACIGQGMATVNLALACETLGLSPSDFVVETPDTSRTPNSGTTTASRQTLFTGGAVVAAANLLKEALADKSLAELNGQEFYGEFTTQTDTFGSDKQNPVSHAAYGYAAQVAVLDENGKLKKIVAAYDAGKIVNKRSCEGQIEGGIVMGVGYATTEDLPLENCVPSPKFSKLGLLRADNVPEMEIILLSAPNLGTEPVYGVKGVGEIATIPTAPAITLAKRKFDGVMRTKLPME